MKTSVKIRLLPTPCQEILFWKSAGTARWAYNYYIDAKEKAYQEWISNGRQRKIRSVTESEIRLEKRLKHEQRKFSRKLENNIKKRNSKGKPIWKRPLHECKNIQRQNNVIRKIYKKIY